MTALTLLAPFMGKILMALGALAGLVAAYFGVRHVGVQAQQNADLKTTLKHVEGANETAATVARLSDAAVDKQLRSEFSRD